MSALEITLSESRAGKHSAHAGRIILLYTRVTGEVKLPIGVIDIGIVAASGDVRYVYAVIPLSG